jgi:hypothetical protein
VLNRGPTRWTRSFPRTGGALNASLTLAAADVGLKTRQASRPCGVHVEFRAMAIETPSRRSRAAAVDGADEGERRAWGPGEGRTRVAAHP